MLNIFKRTAIVCITILCGTGIFAQRVDRDFYVPEESNVTISDTLHILCVGNSFTYYFDSPHKLQEIAGFEGHYLDISYSVKGGWSFTDHLTYQPTIDAINKGGFDVAFLQNQSQAPALYIYDKKNHSTVRDDFERLADNVKQKSPGCRIILERTWSYPKMDKKMSEWCKSEKTFDHLLEKGTKEMARHYGADISPIGNAFSLCRKKYPEINLFHKDYKHPSPEGIYLKSCVNYLILFGHRFGTNPSNCDIDPTVAERLRGIAEKIVF